MPFANFTISFFRGNEVVLVNDSNAGGDRDVVVVELDELDTVVCFDTIFDSVVVNAGISFGGGSGCDEMVFVIELPYVLTLFVPIDGAVDVCAFVDDETAGAVVVVDGFVARLLLLDTGIVDTVDVIAFDVCTVDFPVDCVDTTNLIRFSLLLLLIALNVCVVDAVSLDIFSHSLRVGVFR